jgi:hypothetical protein
MQSGRLRMKKLTLAALALAVLVAGNAVAQQFTVYDAGGRYLSTNTRNGNVTVSSNGSMCQLVTVIAEHCTTPAAAC